MTLSYITPDAGVPFLDDNGCVSPTWYLYLSALFQTVGGPAVVTGGSGVSPTDNAQQFEEYAVSVPDAQEALRGIDELRNTVASTRTDVQTLRGLIDELGQSIASIPSSPASYVTSLANGYAGTMTNDNAPSGYVGELITASLAVGSATSLTTTISKTVTSISLTAGDWDITGVVDFHEAATTSTNSFLFGTSTTNNTLGADDTYGSQIFVTTGLVTTSGDYRNVVPTVRYSFSATTTIYLVAQATFTISTMTAYGTIRARRVR